MSHKRNTLQPNRLSEPATHVVYLLNKEISTPDAIKQHLSPHPLNAWLPTIRSYMLWIFAASVVWEIICLPLNPIWESANGDQIALSTIRMINTDLIIALATLFATLVIFGSNRWPEDGYPQVCLMTIACTLGFSMISYWLFVKPPENTPGSAAAWANETLYAATTEHLKWVVLPAVAFWQAHRATQQT